MKKKFCVKVLLGIVFFSCSSAELFAQSLPGFGDDVNDEVAAPIDSYIFLAASVGLFFGVRKLISIKQKNYEK